MFGKSKRNAEPVAVPPPPPPPVQEPVDLRLVKSPLLNGLQTPAVKPSIISDAVSFVGDFVSKGALHIDGAARGNIEAESITVGVGGSLEGTVTCRKLHVKGNFAGTVTCDDLIISDEAQVEGELIYKSILVARGAHVMGKFTLNVQN